MHVGILVHWCRGGEGRDKETGILDSSSTLREKDHRHREEWEREREKASGEREREREREREKKEEAVRARECRSFHSKTGCADAQRGGEPRPFLKPAERKRKEREERRERERGPLRNGAVAYSKHRCLHSLCLSQQVDFS